MNCKQYRTEIEETDFAAKGAHARAASHADECAECRRAGEEAAALRGLIGGLARVDAPADFEFRLRARIRAAESAETPSWSRFLRPRAAWLAVAGCLALAAALALQTRNSLTPDAPATAQSAAQTAAADAANVAADSSNDGMTRDPSGSVAASDSSGDVATRGSTPNVGGMKDEMVGDESSSPAAGSSEGFGVRRRERAAVAATNVVRTPRRRAETLTAQAVREAVAAGNDSTTQMETNTLSMTGSPVIVSSAIPLPVSADERPLQVLFKDTQGAARVVNVDPITFGSNDAAARPTNVTFTKAAKKHGVW